MLVISNQIKSRKACKMNNISKLVLVYVIHIYLIFWQTGIYILYFNLDDVCNTEYTVYGQYPIKFLIGGTESQYTPNMYVCIMGL